MSAGTMSSVRQFLWPIYGKEHKKFLPMALMIGMILFNYSVLRNIKDALVVTEGGSETITFLKFWVVVPSAFLFFVIYSKLSNVLKKQSLFYVIVIPFLIFFGLFALGSRALDCDTRPRRAKNAGGACAILPGEWIPHPCGFGGAGSKPCSS